MVVNSIRLYPHWQMPKIIWQTVIISVALHVVVLFYMLEDFKWDDSEAALPGNMNIVLKATIKERKSAITKKPEKIKQKEQAKQVKPTLKPAPKPVAKPEPLPESTVKPQTEKKIIQPRAQMDDVSTIDTDEIQDAPAIAQQSYVPPRSDVSYLSNPKPFYPRVARRRGMQGMVILEVEVNVEGIPQKIEIEVSSGFKLLDVAALESVREWHFIPAQRNGMAVVASVDVPVRFVLNEAD